MRSRSRGFVSLLLACSLFVCGALISCGSGGSEKPTKVEESDLNEQGDFWTSLTADLKDELVELGQARLGTERPDGASEIDAIDTARVVAEIDKQYSNEAKRSQTIYETYRQANDTIARSQLEELIPELEQGAP